MLAWTCGHKLALGLSKGEHLCAHSTAGPVDASLAEELDTERVHAGHAALRCKATSPQAVRRCSYVQSHRGVLSIKLSRSRHILSHARVVPHNPTGPRATVIVDLQAHRNVTTAHASAALTRAGAPRYEGSAWSFAQRTLSALPSPPAQPPRRPPRLRQTHRPLKARVATPDSPPPASPLASVSFLRSGANIAPPGPMGPQASCLMHRSHRDVALPNDAEL